VRSMKQALIGGIGDTPAATLGVAGAMFLPGAGVLLTRIRRRGPDPAPHAN